MDKDDVRRAAWRAAISGMDEPPLTDDELDALRRILLDMGSEVSREAQIELLLSAIWWRHEAVSGTRGRASEL